MKTSDKAQKVHYLRAPPQRNRLCESPYARYDRVRRKGRGPTESGNPEKVTCRTCIRKLIAMKKLPASALAPLPQRVRQPALAWDGAVNVPINAWLYEPLYGVKQWSWEVGSSTFKGMYATQREAQVAAEDAIVATARAIVAARRSRR